MAERLLDIDNDREGVVVALHEASRRLQASLTELEIPSLNVVKFKTDPSKLTVASLNPDYIRVVFDGGILLEDNPVHRGHLHEIETKGVTSQKVIPYVFYLKRAEHLPKGIGSRLMNVWEQTWKELGVDTLAVLNVGTDHGVALCEKLGYKIPKPIWNNSTGRPRHNLYVKTLR